MREPTDPTSKPTTVPTQGAEPTTEPTQEPGSDVAPEELPNGTMLTDEQARELNADFPDPDGAYQMPDGTWVKINRDEPLPELVKTGNVTGAGAEFCGSCDHNGAITDEVKEATMETGRKVVAVVQFYMHVPRGGSTA